MSLKRLFLIFMIVVGFRLVYLSLFPNVKIINNETLLNEEYTPTVKCYNLFSDLSKHIETSNNVNISVVGSYDVNVKIKYFIFNMQKNYKVKVVDKIIPIITLTGSDVGKACPSGEYVEEGYAAIDNYDGDITDKVNTNSDDNIITYSVTDSSGNISKVERNIVYIDEDVPTITLSGNQYMTITVGSAYNEPGYSATDNCDGDITDKVVISGSVDNNSAGTYTITYTIEDSSGNKSSAERYVTVKKKQTYAYGNGYIYLTFDDGPSYLTSQILDILDEEGVKATFFVCGANDYTKRAYNSGHTIGLHSNTHEYSYIYASSANYFEDLNAISNKVYNVIGINPKIIRFPGGSSNTVSRNYSYGIMTYLTNEVENRGYTYFDWNISSGDAGSAVYSSTNIYYNVINNLSHSKTNVVLMHDSGGHTATVAALRDIIKFGKEYGYTFKAIDDTTPVVHHGVNN